MTTPTTIVELRSSLLKVPWRGAAPAAGILSAPVRDIYLLEIETQGGLVGTSYLMPLRGGLETLDACMKELVAPHVIGRDATEVEAIWQQLYRSNFWLGRMGVTVFAQSAVDELKALHQKGFVVHIMRTTAWVNFLYLHWAMVRRGLPPVRAVANLRPWFTKPFTLAAQRGDFDVRFTYARKQGG